MQTDTASWQSYTTHINAALDKLLQVKEPEHQILYEAARYAVLGPGKRIRPLLCLVVAEMLQVPISQALKPALAIELIHCYSLIHDDLPAMDNDDFRRGRPTLHRAYPEGIAILAGDYLLTYAFEVLANAPDLEDSVKIRLVRLLAESAGGEGMVGGQVRDINFEHKQLTLSELKELHHRKTGRLIKAAILFGATLARVDEHTYRQLDTIANHIGLIFQIADDIIDVLHSEDKHGKPHSSDIANNKITYVSVLGLAGAQEEAKKLRYAIEHQLDKLPYPTTELYEIVEWITARCL